MIDVAANSMPGTKRSEKARHLLTKPAAPGVVPFRLRQTPRSDGAPKPCAAPASAPAEWVNSEASALDRPALSLRHLAGV